MSFGSWLKDFIKANQPKEDTGYTYTPFTSDEYKESDAVNKANQAAQDAANALKGYGDFSYANQTQLNDAMQNYLNRKDFSYDFNADALYQQYKDKYIQQGKMAMADTMGQAAAMTGGYGNSYAATVGNQAYQASLQNLNDVIPELYQMAYDRYNQEGQDMLNQYSLLSSDRDAQYALWADGYNRLAADRDYYAGRYDSERVFDYGKYSDDRTLAHGEHTNLEGYAYNNYRDKIADAQWQAQFDEAKRQYNEQMAFQKQQYADSKKATVGNPTDKPKQEPQYEAVDNQRTKTFRASMRTKNEFYLRNSADKQKYKTYEAYIDGKLQEWFESGKLDENELATLIAYYGL